MGLCGSGLEQMPDHTEAQEGSFKKKKSYFIFKLNIYFDMLLCAFSHFVSLLCLLFSLRQNFNNQHKPSFTKKNHYVNTKLEVRRIPRELNNITKLNEHFSKFGTIVNIQVHF